MKTTDYQKVQTLDESNIVLVDGNNGTKAIMVTDFVKSLIGFTSSQDFVSGVSLSELAQISTLSAGDKLLIDTAAGSEAVDADDALFTILDAFIPKERRRMIYRGKNQRNVITENQKANTKNGVFKGFFPGNYWSISSYTWRIVDSDYWYNCGDTAFTEPHLVIMPGRPLYNTQINETNITTGGYVGSKMYEEDLSQAKTLATGAFDSLVLTHCGHLTNAVTNGYPSGGSWYDSTLELPNKIMIYGSYVFIPSGNRTIIPDRYTISKARLALFSIIPKLISNHATFWFRDVVSSAYFALVNGNDAADLSNASDSYGARLILAIG